MRPSDNFCPAQEEPGSEWLPTGVSQPLVQAIRRAFLPQQPSHLWIQPPARKTSPEKAFLYRSKSCSSPKTPAVPFAVPPSPVSPKDTRFSAWWRGQGWRGLIPCGFTRQACWSTTSVWDGDLILQNKSVDYKPEQRGFRR